LSKQKIKSRWTRIRSYHKKSKGKITWKKWM